MSISSSIKNADSSKVCSRAIQPSKYETAQQENRKYWESIFELLESDAQMPPQRNEAVIKQLYSPTQSNIVLTKSLVNILGVTKKKFPKFCKVNEVDTVHGAKKKSFNTTMELNLSDSEESVLDSESNWNDPESKSKRLHNVGKINPYMNFFNRPEDRAAIWRPLPQLDLNIIDLNEKADIIVTQIADNFIAWYNTLYDENERTIDVQSIKNMFKIIYKSDAAKSLYVNLKSMKSIPEEAARRHFPLMGTRAKLLQEVRKDVKANQSRKLKIAFGKRLPDTTFTTKEDLFRKWLICDNGPEDTVSMAVVWKGITNLKTTKAFCRYLDQHPEIKPPKFIIDNGLLNEAYLDAVSSSTILS